MKIFYCCSFRFKVLRTETSWSFMNFQIYNCRCGRDFMPVLYNIMRYCKSLDIMRRYEKLLQTLCKLQITRLVSVILPKATILDKNHSDAVSPWLTIAYHGCFHLQNGCIPSPLWYNVAVSNVNKVTVMPRGFANIVPGGGGGFSEVILEIAQHSLYLMCLSE